MATATGSYVTAALLKARLGIADTTDDTVLGLVCDQVNQFVESYTGRVLAPIASAVYTFNGDGTNVLYYYRGIRSVSLVEINWFTNEGVYHTIDSRDYFLLPNPTRPGWPATRIELADIPKGGIGYFPKGYNTVRVTMATGFAAIPDDVAEIAANVATKAWHGIQTGQSNAVGVNDMGQPVVNAFSFAPRERMILDTYRLDVG